MSIRLVSVGFSNVISANRVVAIVTQDSAPSKRIIQEARERGKLIDASHGRRTRSVIVMDSTHVVLSALQPETIAGRIMSETKEQDQ